jgi:hypothetical protein
MYTIASEDIGDGFGSSIELADNILIVGAPLARTGEGNVYVYTLDFIAQGGAPTPAPTFSPTTKTGAPTAGDYVPPPPFEEEEVLPYTFVCVQEGTNGFGTTLSQRVITDKSKMSVGAKQTETSVLLGVTSRDPTAFLMTVRPLIGYCKIVGNVELEGTPTSLALATENAFFGVPGETVLANTTNYTISDEYATGYVAMTTYCDPSNYRAGDSDPRKISLFTCNACPNLGERSGGGLAAQCQVCEKSVCIPQNQTHFSYNFTNQAERLIHSHFYQTEVVAHASNKRFAKSITDGFILDLTDCISGWVRDGWNTSVDDRDYITSLDDFAIHFGEFNDPESDIADYYWSAGTEPWDGSVDNGVEKGTDIVNWQHIFNSTADEEGIRVVRFDYAAVNLYPKDGDKLYFTVKAVNGARNTCFNSSDGIIFDSTPPEIFYVNDGLVPRQDVDKYNFLDLMTGNWEAIDPHTGIYDYEVCVGDAFAVNDSHIGMKMCNEIRPASTWGSPRYGRYNLALNNGYTYYIWVRGMNRAGFWSKWSRSDGVKVGNSESPIRPEDPIPLMVFKTMSTTESDGASSPSSMGVMDMPANTLSEPSTVSGGETDVNNLAEGEVDPDGTDPPADNFRTGNYSFSIGVLSDAAAEAKKTGEDFALDKPIKVKIKFDNAKLFESDEDISKEEMMNYVPVMNYWSISENKWVDAAASCDPPNVEIEITKVNGTQNGLLVVDICHLTQFSPYYQQAPIAVLEEVYRIDQAAWTYLDASLSYDSDGYITTSSWSLVRNPVGVEPNIASPSSMVTVIENVQAPGPYVFALTLWDNNRGQSVTRTTIEVSGNCSSPMYNYVCPDKTRIRDDGAVIPCNPATGCMPQSCCVGISYRWVESVMVKCQNDVCGQPAQELCRDVVCMGDHNLPGKDKFCTEDKPAACISCPKTPDCPTCADTDVTDNFLSPVQCQGGWLPQERPYDYRCHENPTSNAGCDVDYCCVRTCSSYPSCQGEGLAIRPNPFQLRCEGNVCTDEQCCFGEMQNSAMSLLSSEPGTVTEITIKLKPIIPVKANDILQIEFPFESRVSSMTTRPLVKSPAGVIFDTCVPNEEQKTVGCRIVINKNTNPNIEWVVSIEGHQNAITTVAAEAQYSVAFLSSGKVSNTGQYIFPNVAYSPQAIGKVITIEGWSDSTAQSHAILDAVSSTAVESKVVEFKWRVASARVRRPSQFVQPGLSQMLAQDGSRINVTDLIAGDYVFELRVMNDFGMYSKVKVPLFVRQTIDVGDNAEHVVETNHRVLLSGTVQDLTFDQYIMWSISEKPAGDHKSTLTHPYNFTTEVKDMRFGAYTFTFTIRGGVESMANLDLSSIDLETETLLTTVGSVADVLDGGNRHYVRVRRDTAPVPMITYRIDEKGVMYLDGSESYDPDAPLDWIETAPEFEFLEGPSELTFTYIQPEEKANATAVEKLPFAVTTEGSPPLSRGTYRIKMTVKDRYGLSNSAIIEIDNEATASFMMYWIGAIATGGFLFFLFFAIFIYYCKVDRKKAKKHKSKSIWQADKMDFAAKHSDLFWNAEADDEDAFILVPPKGNEKKDEKKKKGGGGDVASDSSSFMVMFKPNATKEKAQMEHFFVLPPKGKNKKKDKKEEPEAAAAAEPAGGNSDEFFVLPPKKKKAGNEQQLVTLYGNKGE